MTEPSGPSILGSRRKGVSMLRNNRLGYYRKKLSILRSKLDHCNKLKNQTKGFVEKLNNKYDSNVINYNEYINTLNRVFNNKSPNDWINYYNNQIEDYQQKIEHYNKKLTKVDGTEIRRGYVVILMVLLISLGAFTLFRFGGITGLITFTESISNTDVLNLTIVEDTEYTWNLGYSGEINSILVSGKIIGRGSAKIYLEHRDQLFLIYEKENNEPEFKFNRECIETCLLPNLKSDSYKLVFEIEEAALILDSINYFRFELFDIDIEQNRTIVEFEPYLFKTYELKVLNKENKDFKVAVFVEGELNNSITLYNSTLEFTSEDEFKIVKYDLDLPAELEPGKDRARIIIKYLPDKKFTGSTPSETHEIEVIHKEEPTKEKSPTNTFIIVVIILLILSSLIWLFKLKSSKR